VHSLLLIRARCFCLVQLEESAPSGMMMRTSYSAQGKLQDDDGKVHAQWNYSFEIKKNWP
jgi:hypothetical protein